MKPQITNLSNMAEILEHRWRSQVMEPETIYTTLGCLRGTAEKMLMGPDTVRFLVETMEMNPDIVIMLTKNGIKFFAEDA